jgi:hypothetical protein
MLPLPQYRQGIPALPPIPEDSVRIYFNAFPGRDDGSPCVMFNLNLPRHMIRPGICLAYLSDRRQVRFHLFCVMDLQR